MLPSVARVRVWALGLSCLGVVAGLAAPRSAEAFVWPNVPERVARALDSSDESERRLAAARLTDLPRELATPLVQKAMGDPDAEVRLLAARAAVDFRVPRAGDLVITWLAESDSRLRLAAADVIQSSPTERSVVALGRVLADPSDDVRFAAAAAMGASGLSDAVSPLLGHLDDASPEVRAEVARALGRIGDARAVVPLVGKVQDSSADVRRAVARALGDLSDDRASSALMLSLQDSAIGVRLEAVTALGKIRSRDATLAIAQLVRDDAASAAGAPGVRASGAPDVRVRNAALKALGQIGSKEAVEVLVGALSTDDATRERTPLRDALAVAGAVAVTPLSTELGRTSSPDVAASAALALGQLEARESVDVVVRAMQRGSLPLRPGLRALAEMAAPSALPVTLELIDDADPLVRRAAIEATAALLDPRKPDGRAVEPVSHVLADATTPLEERIGLIRLLGRSGAPRAQAALLGLIDGKSQPVRSAVLEALGMLSHGSDATDAALIRVLDDESPLLRRQAAMSLSRIATDKAASKLLVRLTVAAEQDRGAIGVAVSGALARATDDGLPARVDAALATAPESAHDALLEGLGRMKSPLAGKVLAKRAAGGIDDRRKVAEALAGHPEQAPLLQGLLADPDTTVRASAVWSAGTALGAPALASLGPLLADPDAAVAGNAAAAIGRIAARERRPSDAAEWLCPVLSDARPYTRANAIAGLALAGAACAEGLIFDRLARDASESVRAAAARYAWTRAGADPAASRALSRCTSDDKSSVVARACDEAPSAGGGRDEVLVYVVPDGRNQPSPRAPFALVLADGLMRLGVADRRGAVFEIAAPRGALRLAVPAPLSR